MVSKAPLNLYVNEEVIIKGYFASFLTDLIKYVLNTVNLTHVTYNGEIYQNRTSRWYSREKTINSNDPDIKCDKIFCCKHPPQHVIIDLSHPINYHFKFDPTKVNELSYCEPIFIRRLLRFPLSNVVINVLIPKIKDIMLINLTEYNFSHKGSDHTKIKLDYNRSWHLPIKFNLMDLVEGLYRIKSRKFDQQQYECFSKVGARINEDILCIYITFEWK